MKQIATSLAENLDETQISSHFAAIDGIIYSLIFYDEKSTEGIDFFIMKCVFSVLNDKIYHD